MFVQLRFRFLDLMSHSQLIIDATEKWLLRLESCSMNWKTESYYTQFDKQTDILVWLITCTFPLVPSCLRSHICNFRTPEHVSIQAGASIGVPKSFALASNLTWQEATSYTSNNCAALYIQCIFPNKTWDFL